MCIQSLPSQLVATQSLPLVKPKSWESSLTLLFLSHPTFQSFSKSFWFSLQNLEFWLELFLVTRFKIALTKSGYHIYNRNWQTISIYPLTNLPYLVLFLFLLRDTYYTIYLFVIFIIYYFPRDFFLGRSFFFSDISQVSGTYWTQCIFIEWLDSSFISFKVRIKFPFLSTVYWAHYFSAIVLSVSYIYKDVCVCG